MYKILLGLWNSALNSWVTHQRICENTLMLWATVVPQSLSLWTMCSKTKGNFWCYKTKTTTLPSLAWNSALWSWATVALQLPQPMKVCSDPWQSLCCSKTSPPPKTKLTKLVQQCVQPKGVFGTFLCIADKGHQGLNNQFLCWLYFPLFALNLLLKWVQFIFVFIFFPLACCFCIGYLKMIVIVMKNVMQTKWETGQSSLAAAYLFLMFFRHMTAALS